MPDANGCTVDGCDQPAHARGYCNKHYLRWRIHGDPQALLRNPAALCTVDGCETPVKGGAHGWCKKHYTRWSRHGDPLARFPGQRPDRDITYYSFHRRIRKARGSASGYDCVECGRQARDWAYVHGTDPRDILNYRPMCHRCHSAYDRDSYCNADAQARWRAAVAAYWTPERRAENSRQVRARNK